MQNSPSAADAALIQSPTQNSSSTRAAQADSPPPTNTILLNRILFTDEPSDMQSSAPLQPPQFAPQAIVKILSDFRKNQVVAFEGMFGTVERVAWCPAYGCYVYFIRLLVVDGDGEKKNGIDMDIMVAGERQLRVYPAGVAVGDSVLVRGDEDDEFEDRAPAYVPYSTFTQANFQTMLEERREKDRGVPWSVGRWEVLSLKPVVRNFYLTYRVECEGESGVGGTSGGMRERGRKWFELCDVRRGEGELGRE